MKKGLFMFAIIYILITAGCMSANDTREFQQQGLDNTANRNAGQMQQIGTTINAGQSEWPGDTADDGVTNTTGGAAIKLLDIKTPVRLGEAGSLSIQGEPDTLYSATAVYNRAGRVFTSTVEKRAGTDGVASWNWDVSADTLPGKYNIMISGGGQAVTAEYTITQ